MGRLLRTQHGVTLADHRKPCRLASFDVGGFPGHCAMTEGARHDTHEKGMQFCALYSTGRRLHVQQGATLATRSSSDGEGEPFCALYSTGRRLHVQHGATLAKQQECSDGEGDGGAVFLDARYRCHYRKFEQREGRRRRLQLEAVSFAQSLEEHFAIQRDVFYDVREDDHGPAWCRQCMFPKTNHNRVPHGKRLQRNRCARTAWWVLMIACFCLFEDLGNGSPHEGRACGAAAEQAEDDAENKASAAQNKSDHAVAEEGFSDDTRLRSAGASPGGQASQYGAG